MKTFSYSKKMILTQIVVGNITFLFFDLIKGNKYNWSLTVIIDLLCFFYKMFDDNVLKIEVSHDETRIFFFKYFRILNLKIPNKDVKAYFEKKMIGRGLPRDVLIIENVKSSELVKISTFLSGFELGNLKEIHNYINFGNYNEST